MPDSLEGGGQPYHARTPDPGPRTPDPDSRLPTPDARYLSCGKLPFADLKYAKGVLCIMFETRDM